MLAHCLCDTIQFSSKFFGDYIIEPGKRPSHSPDLTPLDYFVHSYPKKCLQK